MWLNNEKKFGQIMRKSWFNNEKKLAKFGVKFPEILKKFIEILNKSFGEVWNKILEESVSKLFHEMFIKFIRNIKFFF